MGVNEAAPWKIFIQCAAEHVIIPTTVLLNVDGHAVVVLPTGCRECAAQLEKKSRWWKKDPLPDDGLDENWEDQFWSDFYRGKD